MDELILKVLAETRRLSSIGEITEYEEFEDFIELRQVLTDAVQERAGNLTDDQKARIEELRSFDSAILKEMQRLRDEAMDGMNRLSSSKKQHAAYNNSGVYDSFMVDKRK
ncbi:hypothetical protein [Cohnella lupini]|uniref:Flagellar protein FliT n=1 Tax=Cohnella lupini TaxID=1294267 RepID=A0A3D9I748_9BACL|nr:hypothetical protein [Cohnella lupini]RED57598.1 hypothetical protein DFP95_11071 [Cohnella lupini]